MTDISTPPYKVLPPYSYRRDKAEKAERERSDQNLMIREMRTWLQNNLWREGLTVIFAHDHAPDECNPEHPSLFSGPKQRSSGRETWNGAVDVLVRDEKKRCVPLLLEVEPTLNPKCVFGDVGAAVSSDRHVPSREHSGLFSDQGGHDYYLRDTQLVILTFDQPERKMRRLTEECRRITFSLPTRCLSDVHICSGRTKEEAVTNCKRFLEDKFMRVSSDGT